MKDRIYLDYNATSPVTKDVIEFLATGDFLFVNPSSSHSAGKKAKQAQNKAIQYIYKAFNQLDSNYDIVFHSGATEALNTFFNLEKDEVMVYSESDHPAVEAIAKGLESKGMDTLCLDSSIFFNDVHLETILKTTKKKILLNLTWVNNETGLINNVDKILSLKDKYHFSVHVDAVQSVGKIKDWQKLNQLVDVYSYSAHKFGALKGIGFSFVKKTYNWKPLIIGGGQQNGLRSGTENLTGILSIEAALKDLETKINLSESLNLKNKIISLLKSSLGDKIVILLENEENTAVNTISFIHKEKNADLMLMQFDLNGIDVSFGSACSSGSFKMTQSLRSFGLGNYEKSFIRISFGVEDYENPEILDRLNLVFNKLK